MPNERLWKRRLEKGLTQTALGELSQLRQAEVSQIEKDGWIPPPSIQQRLADALDTTVDELFVSPLDCAS